MALFLSRHVLFNSWIPASSVSAIDNSSSERSSASNTDSASSVSSQALSASSH